MICAAIESAPLTKEGVGVRVPPVVPRILLADDHAEVRRTVASMLQAEFQIVALAEDGGQVIELALRLSPDLMVLDIFMPVVNGIETALRLKAFGCPSRVLFLTADEDPDLAKVAISVGALGYVLKARLATDLVPAIHKALERRA